MNYSEYLKFFDKYVEYNDKGMSKELRDLDRRDINCNKQMLYNSKLVIYEGKNLYRLRQG